MAVWLATDIDDTWTSSARKIGSDSAINVIKGGSSFQPTYISNKNMALWKVMEAGGANILPVTGRSFESCQDMEINGEKMWVFNGIFSHGADMRDDVGEKIEEWSELVSGLILSGINKLSTWKRDIGHMLPKVEGLELVELEVEEGVFGLVVKAKNDVAEEVLNKLKPLLAHKSIEHGLKFFGQHNHFTVIIDGVSKKDALNFWIKKFGEKEDIWIGSGDSVQDGDFMALCDWQMSPAKSDWSKQKIG